MLLAQGGPKQASPLRWSRPYHRAGPFAKVRGPLPTCRPAYLTPPAAQTLPSPSTPRSEIS